MTRILLTVAMLMVLTTLCVGYPYFGGNPQRNGLIETTTSITTKPNMTWHFDDPNGHSFVSNPVMSPELDTVYAASADGFVYGVNATTGEMLFEACVGTPPDFPGDPCGGVKFNVVPYGYLAIVPTSSAPSGITVVVLANVYSKPQQMVGLDGVTGDVLWRLKLRSEGDPTSWGDFLSLPSPAVDPLSGEPVILVWIKNAYVEHGMGADYTVVSAEDGSVVSATTYLTPQWRVFAPMTFDPSDGSVYTQFTNDTQPMCGRNGFQYMHCTGLGKYVFDGSDHLWNVTLQDAFTYRVIALDPTRNIVHTPGSQQYAYAYTTAGRPQWKIMAAPSTGAIYAPTVCPDGTVVYLNNEHEITGWSPSLTRPKKPIWTSMCNGDCPKQATVVSDGTLYLMEGNSIVARSCSSGTELWSIYYGTGESFTNTVAVSPSGALYATVYHGGIGGSIIKLSPS